MVKWVEPGFCFTQTFESQTALFQETHIRFAVLHQFFLEVKENLVVALFLVPRFKLLPSFGGHDFGHVVVDGRDGSHVLLMVGDIELVWEVPLSQFRESKGFGKRGQRHLKKLRESMKRILSCWTSSSLYPFRICWIF